jgi:hypothetical protein
MTNVKTAAGHGGEAVSPDQVQPDSGALFELTLRELEKFMGVKGPGVYVYTLPHYFAHPYDPATGRTLFKVGWSEGPPFMRLMGQSRQDKKRYTALPEDPIVLRFYRSDSSVAEHDLHHALEERGDRRSTGTFCGREWFLTDLGTVDKLARSLSLETVYRLRRRPAWLPARKKSSTKVNAPPSTN